MLFVILLNSKYPLHIWIKMVSLSFKYVCFDCKWYFLIDSIGLKWNFVCLLSCNFAELSSVVCSFFKIFYINYHVLRTERQFYFFFCFTVLNQGLPKILNRSGRACILVFFLVLEWGDSLLPILVGVAVEFF